MVRQADSPSTMKHLRFGKMSTELSDILAGFPGVKSIVLHTHGANGEHPHLHVYWTGDSVTNETIRNRLRKYNDIFKLYSGQNDWSCRPHDNFETWAAYVQRNQTHKVLYVAEGTVLPPPKATDPLVITIPSAATPANLQAPAPRIKKPTSEEKLINYCIVHEGFKYNQWGLAHFEIYEQRQKLLNELELIIIASGHGRLSDPQIAYMGRNVLWTFADPDLRASLSHSFCRHVRKFWDPYV